MHHGLDSRSTALTDTVSMSAVSMSLSSLPSLLSAHSGAWRVHTRMNCLTKGVLPVPRSATSETMQTAGVETIQLIVLLPNGDKKELAVPKGNLAHCTISELISSFGSRSEINGMALNNGSRCAYKGCNNKSATNSNLSFFRFPANDKERCMWWILNSGRDDFYELQDKKLRTRYLCSDHFHISAFTNSTRKRLLYNNPLAVPLKHWEIELCPSTPERETDPDDPGVPNVNPSHNQPPNAVDSVEREANVVQCQIRERCLREPDLRPIDAVREVMPTCTPEVRAHLISHLDTIKRDIQRTRAIAVGGELPNKPAKRKKSLDPDKKKKAKTQHSLSDVASTSYGDQSSHIPGSLTSDSELSPSARNTAAIPYIKEEFVDDELSLKDCDNSGGASEQCFEESESNENNMGDLNGSPSTANATAPFETVVCDPDIQVKQEIIEDDKGNIEIAHEPESMPNTVNAFEVIRYLGNTRRNGSLDDALARTSQSSQDTGTLGYTVPTEVRTVASSQPLVIATSSNTSATSGSSGFKCSCAPTDEPPVTATETPGQRYWKKTRERVNISLHKVPMERRKKTEDKLKRLVKLITELDLDPDEVSFSITTK